VVKFAPMRPYTNTPTRISEGASISSAGPARRSDLSMVGLPGRGGEGAARRHPGEGSGRAGPPRAVGTCPTTRGGSGGPVSAPGGGHELGLEGREVGPAGGELARRVGDRVERRDGRGGAVRERGHDRVLAERLDRGLLVLGELRGVGVGTGRDGALGLVERDLA